MEQNVSYLDRAGKEEGKEKERINAEPLRTQRREQKENPRPTRNYSAWGSLSGIKVKETQEHSQAWLCHEDHGQFCANRTEKMTLAFLVNRTGTPRTRKASATERNCAYG